ncbi:hypothetical protein BOX15_Mlig003903g1 [Macrostomum lignano]|uniref:Ig-like domain-containing protein n=1 Tax=Macrostomum lignano TaxID=282301 RepID=A0A267GI31_9PLAT|nr:hypothetical protein BOX15_Mlig003903g1 [Macrostomum lignano]
MIQYVHLVAVLLAGAACITTASESANRWAIISVGECSARCRDEAPGLRNLTFGCYAGGSAGLVALPGTSPKLYAAKSDEGRLPDDRCSAIQMPSIQSVECPPPVSCTPASLTSQYRWRFDFAGDVRCSARCNQIGSLSVPARCVDAKTGQVADQTQRCESREARPELGLPCYQFEGCVGPVWKAGPWGPCSRPCGLGEMERPVECYQLVDSPEGPSYHLRQGQCSHLDEKPHLREYCLMEPRCPPYYRVSPGKCRPHFSAPGSSSEQRLCNETGLTRNSPQCVQLTGDLRTRSNTTVRVSSSNCRSLPRPPPFSKCQVDVETLRQYRIKCINASAAAKEPQFQLAASSILVQMERRESLQVKCGQSATVIPGTRVRLHCPVANFKPAKLGWQRLSGRRDAVRTFTAVKSFTQCRSRICQIDGDLIITRFRPKDSGVYQVSASNVNTTLSLHSHSAYEAYVQAYLPRMMLLMQPNSNSASGRPQAQLDSPNRDALLWMTGPWTSCSVPCGGEGQKTRTVHCEQLRSSSYSVVPDDSCLKLLGDKPPMSERCGSHVCPVWRAGPWDSECSTQRCYSTGFSLLTRRVQCINQANDTLPDAQCGHEPKPESVHRCRNDLCQPEWLTGPWSKCSVSCGAYGFSSRQIRCVWRQNGGPAGIACENLELPKGYQACYNGPCERLGCEDLSPVCRIYQASALCAHPSLRRNCCKTCGEYQLHVYRSLQSTHLVSGSRTAA